LEQALTNYDDFLVYLKQLDPPLSVGELSSYFGRTAATWRKRGKAPKWAWDFATALEEFPGLLEYYKHLMALHTAADKERRRAAGNPQPPWFVGKRNKGNLPASGDAAASLVAASADEDQPTDHLPVAGA
jgi:hypothetical protein